MKSRSRDGLAAKGLLYMRRSDPDIVQNGHIYSSIREEDVFIYSLFRSLLWVTQRILWAGLIVIGNWIISQRKIVFGM